MTKSPSGGKPREWYIRPGEVARAYTRQEFQMKDPTYTLVREVTEQDKAEGECPVCKIYKPGRPLFHCDQEWSAIGCPSHTCVDKGITHTPASPGEVRVTADLIKELADNCLASTAESDVSAERIKYRKDLYKRTMDEIEKSGRIK